MIPFERFVDKMVLLLDESRVIARAFPALT